MWPKNITLLKADLTEMALDKLANQTFLPCGEFESATAGWSPTRGELIYNSGVHTLLTFTVEKKTVPASAVKLALAERVKEFFDKEGFMPGKLRKKELKEEVIDQLQGRAFPNRKHTQVWINRANGRVIVDSVSNPVLDHIVQSLYTHAGLEVDELIQVSPATHMTNWMLNASNFPVGFNSDDCVDLAVGPKTVRWTGGDLQDEAIADYLSNKETPAIVTSLAMTWNDKVSFFLNHKGQVKKIKPLAILGATGKVTDETYDSDAALMTLEMTLLIDDLLDSLS